MREQTIREALTARFEPLHLDVEDESAQHNVPAGAQSHFKITLVSTQFNDQPLIKRHRAVNDVLKHEFEQGLHALALHTMTPEEWFAKGGVSPDSPPCLGGGKDSN